MEWDAMHRPLEPPPGFEHMLTPKAVFPGLRRTWMKKNSLDDYVQGFKRAWRLYKHQYIYDPEMAKLEESWDILEGKRADRRAEAVAKKGKEAVQKTMDIAGSFAENIRERGPDAKHVLEDRIVVLNEALNEFSKGYNEAREGKYQFWTDEDDKDDLQAHDTDSATKSGATVAANAQQDETKPQKRSSSSDAASS